MQPPQPPRSLRPRDQRWCTYTPLRAGAAPRAPKSRSSFGPPRGSRDVAFRPSLSLSLSLPSPRPLALLLLPSQQARATHVRGGEKEGRRERGRKRREGEGGREGGREGGQRPASARPASGKREGGASHVPASARRRPATARAPLSRRRWTVERGKTSEGKEGQEELQWTGDKEMKEVVEAWVGPRPGGRVALGTHRTRLNVRRWICEETAAGSRSMAPAASARASAGAPPPRDAVRPQAEARRLALFQQ